MTQAGVMPKTDSELNKEYIRFSVPPPLLKQSLQIAAADGLRPAEFHRLLWQLGLALYAEQANKRLVNLRLLANQGLLSEDVPSQSEEEE